MKKFFGLILSIAIILSSQTAFADGDLWDNYGDQNFYGAEKAVSDEDFDKAIESKKGNKPKKMKGESYDPADIAASFQKAVVEVLVENSMKAAENFGIYKFAIAGGVASNTALRAAMKQACEERQIRFFHPSPVYCTDNAAMIGAAG